jgi:hypothetical protein
MASVGHSASQSWQPMQSSGRLKTDFLSNMSRTPVGQTLAQVAHPSHLFRSMLT